MSTQRTDDEAWENEYQSMMSLLGPVDPPAHFVRSVVDQRPQWSLAALLAVGGVTLAAFAAAIVVTAGDVPWSGLTQSQLFDSRASVSTLNSVQEQTTTEVESSAAEEGSGIEPRIRSLVGELTSEVGFAELD